MATQYFRLENLSCPSCVMHLEGMEDELDGVNAVTADFVSSHMVVEFDEAIQSIDGLVQAVAAMGYVAIPQDKPDNEEKRFPWTKLFR